MLVEDADEAKEWCTGTVGFEERADEEFGPGMRWLTVAPPGGDTEASSRSRTSRSTAKGAPP